MGLAVPFPKLPASEAVQGAAVALANEVQQQTPADQVSREEREELVTLHGNLALALSQCATGPLAERVRTLEDQLEELGRRGRYGRGVLADRIDGLTVRLERVEGIRGQVREAEQLVPKLERGLRDWGRVRGRNTGSADDVRDLATFLATELVK